ncbi:S8 family serine peptidase [Streptomyces sp. NPDC048603]|uniref:S53 family peptidase n=1 Tax=Streptomyces sp. NPDC048603 TaxID=3365577 RepID=UPI0037223A5E
MRPVRVLRLLLGAVPLLASLAFAPGAVQARAAEPGDRQQSVTAPAAPGPGAEKKQGTSKPVCSPKPGRAACSSLIRTDLPAVRNLAPGTLPEGLGPRDIRSAYQLPFGAGRGRTVALVTAFHYPTAEADLATYRSTYGLPPCTTANGCFDQVFATGNQPPVDAGWALEAAIDIDAVSAACPACNIVLVEAASDTIGDLLTAVQVARTRFDDNTPQAKYISMSWGDGENNIQPVIDPVYFDFPGVAFVGSSGNTGGVTNWPAISQYVTGVGGTRLNQPFPIPGPQQNRPGGWYETAWSGSGCGFSAFQPKPPWQGAFCNCRTNADVSAVADPLTGIAIYTTTPPPVGPSGWLIAGGTSVAAPLVASMFALAGTPGPNDRPASYPYANPRAFWDIDRGTAGAFSAGLGYDLPSGLGSPRGVRGFRR